jgi:hypothetical protein
MREALGALIQLAAYRHSTPGDQKAALDEIFILPDERRSRWRRTGIRTLRKQEVQAVRKPIVPKAPVWKTATLAAVLGLANHPAWSTPARRSELPVNEIA